MSELENQEKLVMAETIEVIDESVSENITEENLNDENVVGELNCTRIGFFTMAKDMGVRYNSSY